MKGQQLVSLTVVSVLVAILLANVLNNQLPSPNSILAESAPPSTPNSDARLAPPSPAKRNYMPIVMLNAPGAVNCIYTVNGIAGGTVCSGDITLRLIAGGIVTVTNSGPSSGLLGINNSSFNGTAALYGQQGSGSGITGLAPAGLVGSADTQIGVIGKSDSGPGVLALSMNGAGVSASSSNGYGADVSSSTTSGLYATGPQNGVYGYSATGHGVYGLTNAAGLISEKAGVRGESTGANGWGVWGTANSGASSIGVVGKSISGTGVYGGSDSTFGLYGVTSAGGSTSTSAGIYGYSAGASGNGVVGVANNGAGAYGVYGESSSGYAGYFNGKTKVTGNLDVGGTLTKGGGAFKIDHPLDPANQFLYHSFVESPDMKNIYDGVATLDANGATWVELPDWFEALNQDFRYQLTAIGAPAPNLYIAAGVRNNRFRIAGGSPGLLVSWQVTGIRHDPWAEQNRIPVAVPKGETERGKYLYPGLYGKDAAQGLGYPK